MLLLREQLSLLLLFPEQAAKLFLLPVLLFLLHLLLFPSKLFLVLLLQFYQYSRVLLATPQAPAVWQVLLWTFQHPTPDTNCSVCPSFQLQ